MLDISGLDNFIVPHPMNLVHQQASRPPNAQAWTGSGPGQNFIGSDFRAAYVPGVTLTGAGQTVGLLEFDGFYTNDIVAYKSLAGLPNVPVNTEGINFNGSPGGNNVEVALDIDMAISMAPGLSQVIVYEGTAANTILTEMLNDNTAKQLSASWTYSAGKTTSNLFQRLGAQGQSFFNASGDSGAYTGLAGAAHRRSLPYLRRRNFLDHHRTGRLVVVGDGLELVHDRGRQWRRQRRH